MLHDQGKDAFDFEKYLNPGYDTYMEAGRTGNGGGSLGIHQMRQNMDEVRYTNGWHTVELVRRMKQK